MSPEYEFVDNVHRVPFVGGPQDGAAAYFSTEEPPEQITFNADEDDRQAYYQYTFKATAKGDDPGRFAYDGIFVLDKDGQFFVEASCA